MTRTASFGSARAPRNRLAEAVRGLRRATRPSPCRRARRRPRTTAPSSRATASASRTRRRPSSRRPARAPASPFLHQRLVDLRTGRRASSRARRRDRAARPTPTTARFKSRAARDRIPFVGGDDAEEILDPHHAHAGNRLRSTSRRPTRASRRPPAAARRGRAACRRQLKS